MLWNTSQLTHQYAMHTRCPTRTPYTLHMLHASNFTHKHRPALPQ